MTGSTDAASFPFPLLPDVPGRAGPAMRVERGRWVLSWEAPPELSLHAGVAGRVLVPARPEESPWPPFPRAHPEQIHGTGVGRAETPGCLSRCDAAVTTATGLLLTIRVADCVPVFIAGHRGAALAHAGWRGTAGKIAARAVAALAEAAGEDPKNFSAFIGPSIGPCCYDVGEEVARRFGPGVVRWHDQRPRVDLWQANREQLEAAGLDPRRIAASGFCTRCHQHLLHSHRGSGGRPGRLDAWLVRLPAREKDQAERHRS